MLQRRIVLAGIIAMVAALIVVSGLPQTGNPTSRPIAFDVVERSSSPGGTSWEPLIIVISPANLNERDMTLLGLQLKSANRTQPYAFVSVFTDRSAAELRDLVLADEASEEEQSLYDKAYVAQYTKSSNVGFHQFTIFFDGVMGANRQTIRY